MTSPSHKPFLVGPFTQIVTLRNLPSSGPLKDADLEIIENGGMLIENGLFKDIDNFDTLRKKHASFEIKEIENKSVALPGWIDAHTHICYAGSRAKDYAARLEGKSYLEIAKAGGGILDTVRHTREASESDLANLTQNRLHRHLTQGVTTCEIKSGYGLDVESELKILRAIKAASEHSRSQVIPTCLAAHTIPPEFQNGSDYLDHIAKELLPKIMQERLCRRIDAFIEEGAFSPIEIQPYLKTAKNLGFDITIHADQFSTNGSEVAAEVGAISADHLEVSTNTEFALLKNSNVTPVVLPGASLGLGLPFAPARQILDHGLPLAIASDWNPGSAPMGNLLMQASVLAAQQKLTIAETLAALTCRAAKALSLSNCGQIQNDFRADFQIYATTDYRDTVYHQGELKPSAVWTLGEHAWQS